MLASENMPLSATIVNNFETWQYIREITCSDILVKDFMKVSQVSEKEGLVVRLDESLRCTNTCQSRVFPQ